MKYFLVIIITALTTLNISSQDIVNDDSHHRLYFSGGLGIGSEAIARNVSISYLFKNRMGLKFGYLGDSSIYFGPGSQSVYNRNLFLLASITDSKIDPGILFSTGVSKNNFEGNNDNYGLHAFLEVFLIKSENKAFGLSLNAQANINVYRNFAAFLFNLNFGML